MNNASYSTDVFAAANLLSNLTAGRKRGNGDSEDITNTRDELREAVLRKTDWCIYCLYGGIGGDALDLPWFFSAGNLCCIGGVVKCTRPYDQDGCFALSSKCGCCLSAFEYPPDNTPGIGIGPLTCLGNLDTRSFDDCSSTAAKNELDTYQKTFWCWSCYFCFQGCSYDCTPCCAQEGKLCCLWLQLSSTGCPGCCDNGCIGCSSKCCCCVTDWSLPAGFTPGCVFCGNTFCWENFPPEEEPEETPQGVCFSWNCCGPSGYTKVMTDVAELQALNGMKTAMWN